MSFTPTAGLKFDLLRVDWLNYLDSKGTAPMVTMLSPLYLTSLPSLLSSLSFFYRLLLKSSRSLLLLLRLVVSSRPETDDYAIELDTLDEF